METHQPFRLQIRDMMAKLLGPPKAFTVSPEEVFRWKLERPRDMAFYVTLNSPEHPDVAHVMLSDSSRHQARPIESVVVYTIAEAEALIQRILKQWKESP